MVSYGIKPIMKISENFKLGNIAQSQKFLSLKYDMCILMYVYMYVCVCVYVCVYVCRLYDCSIRVTDCSIRVYRSFCDSYFDKQEFILLHKYSTHYASIMLNAFRHLLCS